MRLKLQGPGSPCFLLNFFNVSDRFMWSFFEFLNDDSVVTVLDVGAAMVDSPSYQSLVDAKRARLIGFEPNAVACKKLNEQFGEPHRFYPYFVGDGKPGIFHETNWSPTGSLFEPNTPLLDKFHWLGEIVRPVAQHPVATMRLDDIDGITDVDFVKIDVQGSELAVFENASRVLASAVLIQTEVCFVETYKQQPMFSDLDAFLRRQGYQIHDMVVAQRSFKPLLNSHSNAPHLLRAFRQWIWGDAYYVKDWMHLDRMPPVKLKSMAALLHDILGSYDLAYVALLEMDRQSGTDLAARYLQRLEDDGECVVERGEHTAVYLAGLNAKPEVSPPPIPAELHPAARPPIVLTTADGIAISVPASLNCITTYVLLEQEQWFERETGFILRWMKKGMNAIDIGANVGVFSLPIARRVGPVGKVFAFEPGSENRHNLEAGRMANILRNLTISACALADSEKLAWLQIAASGELNSLGEGQSQAEGSEQVRVTTLDLQEQDNDWPSIDFVKIDAEGQEARIIAGGRNFFARQSPLVMYEVKHGATVSSDLRWTFEALGYRTYRLLGDASCLVPVGSDEELDSFELNLFAAKPDRAARLAVDGLLADDSEPVVLTDEERNGAIDCMLTLPYARSFEFSREDVLECDYGDALVLYAAYRFVSLTPGRRYAVLRAAFHQLRDYCAQSAVPSALASLARVALDLGYRSIAVEILDRMLRVAGGRIGQPFFPACARYEHLLPDEREADWFAAASIEQLEISQAHSSMFSGNVESRLGLLCDSPFASAAIGRRMILKSVRSGKPLVELRGYLRPQDSHGNAAFWSESGLETLMALR
jgi:FkbM family methyltransferase